MTYTVVSPTGKTFTTKDQALASAWRKSWYKADGTPRVQVVG